MLRAFGVSILGLSIELAWANGALAQFPGLSCPGEWVTNQTGGMSCLCPDGSLADAVRDGPNFRVVCPGRTVRNYRRPSPAGPQPTSPRP